MKLPREIPVDVLLHWSKCFKDGTVQDEYSEEISNLFLEHIEERTHMTYVGAIQKDTDSWFIGYGRNIFDVKDGLKDRSDKDQLKTLRIWKIIQDSHPFAITYHRVSLEGLKNLLKSKHGREVIIR